MNPPHRLQLLLRAQGRLLALHRRVLGENRLGFFSHHLLAYSGISLRVTLPCFSEPRLEVLVYSQPHLVLFFVRLGQPEPSIESSLQINPYKPTYTQTEHARQSAQNTDNTKRAPKSIDELIPR